MGKYKVSLECVSEYPNGDRVVEVILVNEVKSKDLSATMDLYDVYIKSMCPDQYDTYEIKVEKIG